MFFIKKQRNFPALPAYLSIRTLYQMEKLINFSLNSFHFEYFINNPFHPATQLPGLKKSLNCKTQRPPKQLDSKPIFQHYLSNVTSFYPHLQLCLNYGGYATFILTVPKTDSDNNIMQRMCAIHLTYSSPNLGLYLLLSDFQQLSYIIN